MKNDLQKEITATKEDLLKKLDLFDQDNINIVPFERSWTGGQVAEHILKSIAGILETVKGPTKPTERDPTEHIQQLKDIFLNMDIKMQSPDFIIPSDEPKAKAALASALESTLDGIEQVAGTEDISATCTAFDMPMMGPLTRMEWISFASFHTRRHTYQLKKIAVYLKGQTV